MRIKYLAVLGIASLMGLWHFMGFLSEWRAEYDQRERERIERLENMIDIQRELECEHNPTAGICE